MMEAPIIDSHVHLWDTRLFRYPWLHEMPALNRPFLLDDYRLASASTPVEAMIFVQCEVEPSAAAAEAAWVSQLEEVEPRLKGMVAWAPLEKGSAVAEDLRPLKPHAILRGIRRIIQSEPDLDFCLRPNFIEGVRTLKDFDLSFDLCIDHRHMANILKFVERVPEVAMVLDHLGKPPIRDGALQPWADQLRELARFPQLWW